MSRPLWKKLGLRAGQRVYLDEAPDAYPSLLARAPKIQHVTLDERPNLIHHFTTDAEGLRARLAVFQDALAPRGSIWISWPKQSSGVPSDVSRDVVRAAAGPLDLVDVKVASIDATWTALKLKTRKP